MARTPRHRPLPRPLGEAVADHTKQRRKTRPQIAAFTESLAPFLSAP